MKIKSILFILAVAALFAACKRSVTGKGEMITDERALSSFKNVTLEGAGNITITKGANEHVAVKGYENLVKLIETHVQDDALLISTKKSAIPPDNDISIEITTPELAAVQLNGAGNIDIVGFQSGRMELTLRGAGNVRFSNTQCDSVYAIVSGAGNMYVNATGYLEATVNGVGTIEYAGDPVVHSKVSGIGKVKKK